MNCESVVEIEAVLAMPSPKMDNEFNAVEDWVSCVQVLQPTLQLQTTTDNLVLQTTLITPDII